MRRLITFACQGATLVGTLDDANANIGVLVVAGGNEVRVGAHRGMADLAARLAAAGYPVFRFDRRGVGDSEGENAGWASSAPDIAAAASAFRRAQPRLTRLVALGNCDAATALACFAADAGIDALVLTNPWTGDDADALPPAAAIRHRYLARLRDPASWRRGFDAVRLFSGLRKLLRRTSQDIADRTGTALTRFPGPVTLVLATGDATALGFRAALTRATFANIRARTRLVEVPTASHSFQHGPDATALEAAVLAALR